MRKGFWNFYFSRNKRIYKEIARKYQALPWRVYELAHGKRVRTSNDGKILNELLERGIINEIKPW